MALTVCRPWHSVQPTGMKTMSFLRRFSITWWRTVVWM